MEPTDVDTLRTEDAEEDAVRETAAGAVIAGRRSLPKKLFREVFERIGEEYTADGTSGVVEFILDILFSR